MESPNPTPPLPQAQADPFFDRNVVFGVQDSLISTCGLVVGIAASGMDRRTILITGSILVFVEALSMSFGSFLSEDSFMVTAQKQHTGRDLIKYAGAMFVSYVIAGMVPMLPFILSESPTTPTMVLSVSCTLIALYMLVMWIDRPQKNHKKTGSLTVVGAIILAASIFVGTQLKGV